MTYMDDIHQTELGSINDFIMLHNNNMEVLNNVLNKLIAASNRQNKKIFWLEIGLIVLGASVFRMTGKLDKAQQQIALMEANTTEEK